jgi:hypothetical protein
MTKIHATLTTLLADDPIHGIVDGSNRICSGR